MRPSRPRPMPTTTCSSPMTGRESTRAVIRGEHHQPILEVAGPAADAVEGGPGDRQGCARVLVGVGVEVLGDARRRVSTSRRPGARGRRPRGASATRPGRSAARHRARGRCRRRSRSGRGGWCSPAYDASAARASSAGTGARRRPRLDALADSTGLPSYDATHRRRRRGSPAQGHRDVERRGRDRETATVGHGRAWSSGQALAGVRRDRARRPAAVAGRGRPAEPGRHHQVGQGQVVHRPLTLPGLEGWVTMTW